MAAKHRYLQISDVMMFEMKMLGEDDSYNEQGPSTFLYGKLIDGHNLLFSPIGYECEQVVDHETGNISYKKRYDPITLNTLNHIAVPKDKHCSLWYNFLDPDYEYIDESIMGNLNPNQIKAKEYFKYIKNPSDETESVQMFTSVSDVRWDSIRLYFVNGYDFSNIYGILMRISIDGNNINDETERIIDLCDFFFNKSNAYKLIKYLSSPIIFGNNIYDRYIEIKIPCLYDIFTQYNISIENNLNNLFTTLSLKENSTLKLSFSHILEDETTVDTIDYSIIELTNSSNITNDLVNLSFTRSDVMSGTIPSANITSDNLGAYIAECPDMPYLVFYGTWKDKPLTSDIVWQFNRTIKLYDTSLVKKQSAYEVDKDYKVQTNYKNWICMHEIKCTFCMADQEIKSETYSMTQIFSSPDDPHMFYYRPLIFDEAVGLYIDNVKIDYTMRFINSDDKVQFVKTASFSLYGNMAKYYAKGTSLTKSQLTPYKIYNKIIENKHESVVGNNNTGKTKYIKVFYNSTDIVLDNNGNAEMGNYSYTLNISSAPKSYKFTFKKLDDNGSYTYMDLTNGYFKLLFKDASGIDNLIEPTYSSNMNLYVGEVEFNFNSSILSKLFSVPESERKMSIVSFNEDGTVSSMFDFMYSI